VLSQQRCRHKNSRCLAYAAARARTHGLCPVAIRPYVRLRFSGLSRRIACKYMHGLLLVYRSRWDERPSWPSWLAHSEKLIYKVVICQPERAQVRESPPAKEQRPNHWSLPPTEAQSQRIMWLKLNILYMTRYLTLSFTVLETAMWLT